MLRPEQQERYIKQMGLPGLGESAQEKLVRSKVLVLGLSGSGAVAARFLAGAGVGTIGLLDNAPVSLADIYQQILCTEADVGLTRAAAAQSQLICVNPDISIRCHEATLDSHNAEAILSNYDIIVDGLEDWQLKLLLSDSCMQLHLPLIHSGVSGFRWQLFTMAPGRSACLRCVFNQLGMEDFARHDQQQAGPSGPASGMAGSMQASEAVQLITGAGVAGCDEFISFDCLRREFFSERNLHPRSDCPDCGRWVS